MKEVIKLFTSLQNTSSKNEKERIIKQNRDNELFKKCLIFLLDSNIVTGINKKKLEKALCVTDELHIPNVYTWEDCMEYLKEHNTGTDLDIREMQDFLRGQNETDREFYIGMITKSLRLGCDAKIVNKSIPGLIPVFDVMLGTPFEKCKLPENTWISISQKLNGTRAAFVDGKLLTRQGKEYVGMNHIISDIKTLGYENMFIDGELLYTNEEGLSDSEAFQKGTGIAMSKDGDKSQLKMVVFDAFPLGEFRNGKSKQTYRHRKEQLPILQKLIMNKDIKNIEVVPLLYEGTDHTQIWKWLDYAEEHDWEGCMINLDEPYECKRVKHLMKVKKFFSCDLICTGIEEGSGRNEGTLGALVCIYKGNEIRVGSGFNDETRRSIWENPDSVIGKIVSVKYKEETKNKDGGVSLQFPVFEAIRHDKSEPSYN